MEAAKGVLYLAMALSIVLWGTRNKTLSWPVLGWVMLLAVAVGGAGVWCSVVLLDRIGTANPALTIAASFGPILLAVVLITLAAIGIARRYEPPAA